MTSGASDQSLLAQLGTDSDCQGGIPQYFMWWEMFPAPSVPLNQPLQAGDSATASVTFQNGKFQLRLDVPGEGVHFTTTGAGSVSDTSIAECIVEAPTIIDNLSTNMGHVAQLTDFGQVSVLCQLNNNEPIADGPQDVLYQMQTNTWVSKATTSALDQSGATFTVQWHHG
jgi:Peptidase A4 family